MRISWLVCSLALTSRARADDVQFVGDVRAMMLESATTTTTFITTPASRTTTCRARQAASGSRSARSCCRASRCSAPGVLRRRWCQSRRRSPAPQLGRAGGGARYAGRAVLEEGCHRSEISVLGGLGRYFMEGDVRRSGPLTHGVQAIRLKPGADSVASRRRSSSAPAFRAVIAYGYHYAPAEIDDRVRGSVEAGGQEFSIGIGVVL